MTALQDLDRLLADPNRHAVLPREVAGSPSAVHRALRKRCDDRTLQRVGTGIYARSASKLFDVVPEILPKLGYEILPVPQITNRNFKHGGSVWRIDRPCRRLIVKHGVKAVFESPRGKSYKARLFKMPPIHEPPSRREIEVHFSSYDRCHSYARAEKDLIVKKALRAWQGFRHPDATLALDGATCLTVYCNLRNRFSEDIDMRVILADELEHGPADRRIAAFREVSGAFAEHVHKTLPFLKPTRKGRFRRRDGRYESHIFDYEGRMPHKRVVEGLKLELAQKPNRLPLFHVRALGGGTVQVISPMETSMGKWQAVCERLPGRARIYPELIRHPWDLGSMSATLEMGASHPAPDLAKMIGERRGPAVSAALRELYDPAWQAAFDDYAHRMATRPISDFLYSYADPPWSTVRSNVALVALDMDLVPVRDRREVLEMVEGRWAPRQPGLPRDRGGGNSR